MKKVESYQESPPARVSWTAASEETASVARDNGVTQRVRLTRKLAERLNGVDLSKVCVGDSFDLPPQYARILIAEGWAELV